MDVLTYQLAVVASVSLSYFLKGHRIAFAVCIGWTVWTIALVFWTPLAFIQLAVCWGSYAVCTRIQRALIPVSDARSIPSQKTQHAAEPVASVKVVQFGIAEVAPIPSATKSEPTNSTSGVTSIIAAAFLCLVALIFIVGKSRDGAALDRRSPPASPAVDASHLAPTEEARAKKSAELPMRRVNLRKCLDQPTREEVIRCAEQG